MKPACNTGRAWGRGWRANLCMVFQQEPGEMLRLRLGLTGFLLIIQVLQGVLLGEVGW
ncbi:hypothetical protein GCM10011378_10200 [Hymenobacter glacieicola]|uniref:Uncharacterized protein n=1 Tax=Hymenobacter glacieicola TaxID=1562124 RepID=A0ABQ1WLY7_9BACT|nr:hypothetical protein GCM10011378_10200 [Hymenobacter glacieicola]